MSFEISLKKHAIMAWFPWVNSILKRLSGPLAGLSGTTHLLGLPFRKSKFLERGNSTVAKPSSMKRMIKSFVERFNSAAYRTGVQIVPVASSVRFGQGLKRLKAVGLHPATVFDVGVAYGTPDIYHEFGDAKYHLIDAVPQALPYMRRWATKLNASIHNIGIGEADAVMPIDVWEEIDGSTFFKEVGQGPDYHSVLVPVKRFDSVFSAKDMVRPCMLKIDVQGAELSVLKGVGELIKNIDLLIVETRLINTQVGG